MRKRETIWMTSMLAIALSGAWAQDSPPAQESAQGGQQPVSAYGQGQDNPPSASNNPPISGLDVPSLEPSAAPLSYLQPGATVSESADTNIGDALGGGSVGSVTRALGSLTLRRLWSHYDLALDYLGGVAYYTTNGVGLKQLHDLGLDQKIAWKRGQLSIRDSFSYLPEGNFGDVYGSLGSQGILSLGNSAFGSFWGGTALGTLGVAPRILNVSIADVTENLSSKSSLTAAGGYAFTHFYGSDFNGTSFIGSSQTSAQVGYNRQLNPNSQVALVYGYQGFDFSVVGTAFHSHIIQAMYGHRISGRMDFTIGAGPQITFIDSQSAACSDPAVPLLLCTALGDTLGSVTDKNTKLGVSAQARLRYRFTKTMLDLSYERFETSGAGLFAGSQSDIARLTATRPLTRVWNASFDVGYARNGRIQPLTVDQLTACLNSTTNQNACPANDANTYSYGFAGVSIDRHFGHDFHGFLSYQENELWFDQSYCVAGAACNRISNRSVVTIGLDWTPRPTRLD
jgi:hypothetical protein